MVHDQWNVGQVKSSLYSFQIVVVVLRLPTLGVAVVVADGPRKINLSGVSIELQLLHNIAYV